MRQSLHFAMAPYVVVERTRSQHAIHAELSMKALHEFLSRHSLGIGIFLMFLLTWPIDLSNSGAIPFRLPFVVYLFLGWGFVAASLIMTKVTLGSDGVFALLKRYLVWRVDWFWYLVALLLYPAILFSAVALSAVWARTTIDFSTVVALKIFGPTANLPAFVVPFLLVDAVANGEEIGWRGYVLPRLQARHNALTSSLIVGLMWGFWHFPKFLAPGNTSPFGWYMARVMTDAVLYTWLYNNTKGSLLLVTLFHATGNTAGVFLPVANTATGSNPNTLIVQVVLQGLFATAVTLWEGPENLSRTTFRQVQLGSQTVTKRESPHADDVC